jgi:mono/diheme cytochrome c family protein
VRTIALKIVTADVGTFDVSPPSGGVLRVHAAVHAASVPRGCGDAAGFFRMMRGRMPRLKTSFLLPLLATVLALPLAACGEQKIELASSSPQHAGAELFQQRCAGCHTFGAAATQGSSSNVRTRERTDGPNFNTRRECIERVLYAIENGGFSGAIMPQNIVVGDQARAVADFVARYAGADADSPRPNGSGSSANGFRCTGQRDVGAADETRSGAQTGAEGQSGDAGQ